MLKKLDDLDIKGKRVLLRVDINEPEEKGRPADDFRIRQILPTIKLLKERGAKRIIVLSHRSRPKQGAHRSLGFIVARFAELLEEEVVFVPVIANVNRAIDTAGEGSVILLENLRMDPGEEENNPAFARRLKDLGDVFVQEAFGVLHRAHASTVILPTLLPSAAGPLVEREVEVITKLKDKPKQPYVAVIGGAKISTKLPVIEALLPNVQGICLGGALANTVLRAKGIAIGRSIIEEATVDQLKTVELTDTKLHLPIDVVVSKATDGSAPSREAGVGDVLDDEFILDIGPETQELFRNVINDALTVFWNGPMGLVEVKAFRWGTIAIAGAIANSSAYSVVGGGDTTVHVHDLKLEKQISFISTGGGSMLELLAGEALPGLVVLEA